jgi:hypothetical protein
MLRITKLVILAALVCLLLAPAASAQLTPRGALGEINTATGFPAYVQDVNGVKLDLYLLFADPVILDNPWSVTTGFGAEGFFYMAESRMDLPGGGRALLVLAVEAAYGAGPPMNGDQFLFSRVRIRIDAPENGTYTVKHPWGQKTFVVDTVDKRNINDTFDFGGLVPPCTGQTPCFGGPAGFERLLISPTPWVFLTAANANATFIGDGATETTVSGGLNDNVFRIEGPNIGGNGINFIENPLFIVSGHLAP